MKVYRSRHDTLRLDRRAKVRMGSRVPLLQGILETMDSFVNV